MANDAKDQLFALIDQQARSAGLTAEGIAGMKAWAETEVSNFNPAAKNINTHADGSKSTDSGVFQFNSRTVAGMKDKGLVPANFDPTDVKQAVPAAITYFKQYVQPHMDSPVDMYRSINGPKAEPANIQRYVDNYKKYLANPANVTTRGLGATDTWGTQSGGSGATASWVDMAANSFIPSAGAAELPTDSAQTNSRSASGRITVAATPFVGTAQSAAASPTPTPNKARSANPTKAQTASFASNTPYNPTDIIGQDITSWLTSAPPQMQVSPFASLSVTPVGQVAVAGADPANAYSVTSSELTTAMQSANQASASHQAQLAESRNMFLESLNYVKTAVGTQYEGAADELLANLTKAVGQHDQQLARFNQFMPEAQMASWAAKHQSEGNKALELADQIEQLSSKHLLNDPIGYLINQFKLPALTQQYNTAIHKKDLASNLVKESVEAIRGVSGLDRAASDLITTAQTTALTKQKAGLAMEKMGIYGIDAAKTLAGFSESAQNSAIKLVGLTAFPLEEQHKRLQILAGASELNLREQDRLAQEAITGSALTLFKIPHTEGNSKAVFDKLSKSPKHRAILTQAAASGNLGDNVIDVLENVQELGGNLLKTDPGQAEILTNIARVMNEVKPAATKSEAFLMAKSPKEQQVVLAKAVWDRLVAQQADVSNGGTANLYFGISPNVFFGKDVLPSPYSPNVTPEFKTSMQNALNLGTIRAGDKQQNSDIIHTLVAAQREGTYAGDDTKLASDLQAYFKSVQALTNQTLGVREKQIPPLTNYRSSVLLATSPETRNNASSFSNMFTGKYASDAAVFDLTDKAQVQHMLTQIKNNSTPSIGGWLSTIPQKMYAPQVNAYNALVGGDK